MFKTYCELGFDHILDATGYDHIVFIIALCAVFATSHLRKLLILVTAFTLGHSVTLGLSALDIFRIKASIIEWLIPLTILFTAILNITRPPKSKSDIRWHYILALAFGFIHGMGFSNYFNALLGRSQEILGPLFAFNVGVELGQLIIVALILGLNHIFVNWFNVKQKSWTIFFSGLAFGIASMIIIDAIQAT